MEDIHPLAARLNHALSTDTPAAYALLSTRGKAAYFPEHGILSQAAEADGARLNATIGIALDDDRTPMRLGAIADATTLHPSDVFPYVSAYGMHALRTEWRKRILRSNPSLHDSNVSLPVVTAGMTHALSIAAILFTDRNTTLLLPTPYWDNYEHIFADATGATLAPFPLFTEQHGRTGFATDALHTAIETQGESIALLLNFPNNPTGYSASTHELHDIVTMISSAATSGKRIVVFVDDAYFGLAYRDAHHESIFSSLTSLHENVLAIKIDGPTKEDFAWGLRVGFLTFGMKGLSASSAAALEAKAAGIVRGSVSSGSRLSQTLVLQSLRDERTHGEKQEKFRILQERYVEAVTRANDARYIEAFTPLPSNAGYFLCLKPCEGIDAETVRLLLLQEYSTGIISTCGLLRIAFSSIPTNDIAALFENVFTACMRVKTTSAQL